jgi:uncharacterized protein YjbI with pentapeptide repeats
VTARAERRILTGVLVVLLVALGTSASAAAAEPLVSVDANLHKGPARATITARIRWNAGGVQAGMTVGDLRAVAVDADTTVPTLLAKTTENLKLGEETRTETFTITGRDKLEAIRDGNRVVLTATQHAPVPDPPVVGSLDTAFATVDQLQAGPRRGRVGSADCSDRPIGTQAGATGLLYCDLVGASLTALDLSNLDMHMVDFTGGVLRYTGLSQSIVSGGRISGVDASGAMFDHTEAVAVTAPRLTARDTYFSLGTFLSSTLSGADFAGSTFVGTSLDNVMADQRSSFEGTTLGSVDLAFAKLRTANFEGATLDATSMYFANLTEATLRRAAIGETQEHGSPLEFATLCRTVMPPGLINNRDCPRPRRR